MKSDCQCASYPPKLIEVNGSNNSLHKKSYHFVNLKCLLCKNISNNSTQKTNGLINSKITYEKQTRQTRTD